MIPIFIFSSFTVDSLTPRANKIKGIATCDNRSKVTLIVEGKDILKFVLEL